jgi:hypothetical protein
MHSSSTTLATPSVVNFASNVWFSLMPFRGTAFVRPRVLARLVIFILACSCSFAQKAPESAPIGRHAPIIWTDPGDIRSKDLFNGPGGQKNRPQLPVRFLKEDQHGHNAKFDVQDSSGTKWRAKLGIEAQPETVATRLLWAIGYFTNEDYFVPDLEVSELPAKLHRGNAFIVSPNHVHNVRLERHVAEGNKGHSWSWRHNPFVGKREFSGLRVMMALISNWDLKDENNGIFNDKQHQSKYLVTDVGTALGASGDRWTEAQSKNNLKAYQRAKFITKVTPTHVDFSFPRFPPILYIFDLPHYLHQVRLRWVGNRIPREDAKWVGSLLTQLSTEQIQDAFRAGGYAPDQAAAFTKTVQARIAELNQL